MFQGAGDWRRGVLGLLARWGPALILVVAGCGQPAGRSAGGGPAARHGTLVASDGVRLFYRTVGDGPRVVVVPGDFLFSGALDRLARGRKVVFYDMRNRGRSDSLTAEQQNSIQRDVADLDDVRRHVGADTIDVVGFSYLGFMVALYALEHPGRVRRVVQIGTVPYRFGAQYPAELQATDYEAAMDSSALAELRQLQREGYPWSHPREYCEREWQVIRFSLVGDPAHVERLGHGSCEFPNEWPTHLATHFDRHIGSIEQLHVPRERIASLAVPVLTIHGTRDRNAPYGGGREWALTLPDARLVTVEGAAHCSWADDPEGVLGAIDTFLGGEWPASAEKVTALLPAAAGRPAR